MEEYMQKQEQDLYSLLMNGIVYTEISCGIEKTGKSIVII